MINLLKKKKKKINYIKKSKESAATRRHQCEKWFQLKQKNIKHEDLLYLTATVSSLFTQRYVFFDCNKLQIKLCFRAKVKQC